MLFDSVSRASVVAQSDEFEMPAMIAFSPSPGTRFRAASSGRTQITLKRLAADASPVIPCSEEMPPSISRL